MIYLLTSLPSISNPTNETIKPQKPDVTIQSEPQALKAEQGWQVGLWGWAWRKGRPPKPSHEPLRPSLPCQATRMPGQATSFQDWATSLQSWAWASVAELPGQAHVEHLPKLPRLQLSWGRPLGQVMATSEASLTKLNTSRSAKKLIPRA